VDPGSEEAETLVKDIRDTDVAYQLLVAGQTADLVDTRSALFGALPWAVGIIAAVTFVVLFLMFGSVLVPAKALVLNLLSLSATFGALVWVFQDGNLSNLLGFTPTGSLDLTMPILIFCIAFGLSMDYEVFLLSRIKEERDAGADNIRSVAGGLERTGRIVTAAAVLIAVVFVAFGTSSVTMIKMFGVGMTLAVLVDAFLIRATLVPAFMRLAGNANWWAPGWMAAIHRRFGFSESAHLGGTPPILEPEAASR
jgi:RND superfamily putative drug exporter